MDDQTVARFWDNYLEKLETYRVKPAVLRWHVQHVEHYIKAFPDRRLATHTAQDIEQYLQGKGRNARLKDWQFQQIVTALQVLFIELVKAPWAPAFPWQDWSNNARGLPSTHATVARDYDTSLLAVDTKSGVDTDPKQLDGILKQFKDAFPDQAERLITEIRLRQYSIRTEQAYLLWLARFTGFHSMRNPANLDPDAIVAYLEHLVVKRRVSGSTQSQALNALLFFYKQVLKKERFELGQFAHSKKPRRLPVVLTRDETQRLLSGISHPPMLLMANLLYGCGMRLME